jgi:hypothetical protein
LKAASASLSPKAKHSSPATSKSSRREAFLDRIRNENIILKGSLLDDTGSSGKSSGLTTAAAAAPSGLNQLRQLATARGKIASEMTQQQEKQKQVNTEICRLNSLGSLCDVLKSNAMITKRTSFPLREVVQRLSQEMLLTEMELLARIKLLFELVPEFVKINTPNQVVPMATLKLNFDCVYEDIREKLVKLVSSRVATLKSSLSK